MEYVKGDWKVRVNRDDTKVYDAVYTEILDATVGGLICVSVSDIEIKEPFELEEIELLDKNNEVCGHQKMPGKTKLKIVPERILHIDFKLNVMQLTKD